MQRTMQSLETSFKPRDQNSAASGNWGRLSLIRTKPNQCGNNTTRNFTNQSCAILSEDIDQFVELLALHGGSDDKVVNMPTRSLNSTLAKLEVLVPTVTRAYRLFMGVTGT